MNNKYYISNRLKNALKEITNLTTQFDGNALITDAYNKYLEGWRKEVNNGQYLDRKNFEKDLAKAVAHYEKRQKQYNNRKSA